MKNYTLLYLTSLFILLSTKLIAQGPFAPAANQVGSTAIHKDSSIFIGWATNATITRGWQDISDTSLGKTTVGNDTSATGKSGVNGVVSLGDGGSAILTFSSPITNGQGADFAVFENAFNATFLELAFVEVSSDGTNFFRFDAVSLSQDTLQFDNNAIIDATNLNNLAGKYQAQYGTPFDLEELNGTNGLDINNITHIKIIDVVGSINPIYASFDSQNNSINDPFPTPFPSGGFDLDAVGVIHSLATSIDEELESNFSIYPNPFNEILNIKNVKNSSITYHITDVFGKVIIQETVLTSNFKLETSNFKPGIYFLNIISENQKIVHKILKQ